MPISNFISNLKTMWVGTSQDYFNYVVPPLVTGNGINFNMDNADTVGTVYNCIRILSETVGKIPVNVYSDVDGARPVDKTNYLYPLLHYQPNGWTNANVFFSTMEYWRSLKGNSFARIYRDAGKVTSLVPIPPSKVLKYAIVNGELYYTLKADNDKEEVINASEILHFKGITKDGIWGVSNITALGLNISAQFQGIQAIDSFYKNGAMSPRAMRSTVQGANLKAMIEAQQEWQSKYSGSLKAGMMPILPPNTDLIDMSISIADAAIIESLKYNTQQIGAMYGIPAWMLGILEATKFNSVETMQQEFKATTLAAIGRMYRQELEAKLLTTQQRIDGVSIEFNWEALYEIDSTARINNLKTLASLGVITPNQIAKLEGWSTYPEGDLHMMPGNYIPMETIAKKPLPPTNP